MADTGKISNPNPINITIQAMEKVRRSEAVELRSEQIASQRAINEALSETVNPFALARRDRTITQNRSRINKAAKMRSEGSHKLLPLEQIKELAERRQQKNPELRAQGLLALRDRIKETDSKEEILDKMMDFYHDVTLAEEAFEFLLETSGVDLTQKILEAREDFRTRYSREIAAGRNIANIASEAADKGLDTPSNLRNLYRDVTGNPKESTTLFHELSQKYVFADLKKVVDFLLHSLGADLKSKGPSIPRGQLHRLLTETRSLQAILGVYRYFKGRMGLVSKLFQKEGLDLPPQLNFENLAKQFMGLASDRYPSSDKVMQTAVKLGIEKWIMAKIIAFSQFRDAIREVAINQIYRSLQHRDDLYLVILEALEDLEDEWEELMEQEDQNENDDDDDEEDDEDDESHGVT